MGYNYYQYSCDYSIKNAMCWGYSFGHLDEAKKNEGGSYIAAYSGTRRIHLIIAAIEFLPIIGQIVSLFEMIFAKLSSVYIQASKINQMLDAWVLENANQKDYHTAKLEIMSFIKHEINSFHQQACNLSLLSLRTLPNVFDLPIFSNKLFILSLASSELTTLPGSIGQLSELKRLDLRYNSSLTGLPLEILDLPRTCMIDLTGCNLSSAVLTELRERTRSPDYDGPRISYSLERPLSLEEDKRTLDEIIQNLYAESGKECTPFINIPKAIIDLPEKEKDSLRIWLSRLSYMSDYKCSDKTKLELICNIIKYLELAEQNEQFRECFFLIIDGAAKTCGDRITLSVLNLGIAFKLATIDLKDMKNLADFIARGVWAINLLEKIAAEKIVCLPFFDEIEVYLGYPIMLKDKLKLPLDVDSMLYFNCSALQQKDLDEAEQFILAKLANKQALMEFLVSHDTWNKALLLNYPQEYAAIEAKKKQSLEMEDPDYIQINAQYNQDLINLTEQALA